MIYFRRLGPDATDSSFLNQKQTFGHIPFFEYLYEFKKEATLMLVFLLDIQIFKDPYLGPAFVFKTPILATSAFVAASTILIFLLVSTRVKTKIEEKMRPS